MIEVHCSITATPTIEKPIHACIGYFDGIHLGHQKLISAVVSRAKQEGGIPALITFDPDPWAVIKGMHDIPHLTSMEERKQFAQELGVELWVILDFTEEMAALSVTEFHEKILFPLPLQTLVCGYDFHYAHLGQGSVDTLQSQTKFDVVVIDEVSSEESKISSTRIERLVMDGEMEKAKALLTRPYQMSGTVVHGLKNGRKLGFPTANLYTATSYVCPKEGVYAGEVMLDGHTYPAMINVGKNPTIGDFQDNRIEAHIFEFDQDIYGTQVSFSFLHYLRGDVKFSSLEELSNQLCNDELEAKAFFAKRQEVSADASSSI